MIRAFRFVAIVLWLASGAPATRFSGEALTTNQLADSLSFIDLSTMKAVAEIKIGGKPAGIALSPDKSKAYITAPDGQELVEVDAHKREVSRRLKLGGGPLGIAVHPTNGEVYVADWYFHKISVVETKELKAVAEIAVGQSPSGLAVSPDGRFLISADRDSDQISIVDIATRTVAATVATGKRPFGVTISAGGTRAYTANVASDDVTVIDLNTRKAAGTIKAGHRPYAIAFAQGLGFSTDQGVGTVTVFDPSRLTAVKTIEACDHPEGIEASNDGMAVFVACWGDNVLLQLDARTFEITGKAATGDGPRAFGAFLR